MSAAAASASGAPDGASETGIRLDRRNVYVLPTGHGLTFAAVTVVTLVGATNYNNSLAFTLSFLLASLGLISMLHTWRTLAGLRLRVSPGDPVSAGTHARLRITLDNTGGRERAGLVLRQGLPGRRRRRRPGRPDTRTDLAVGVDAGDVLHVTLPVPALRRGWLEPERLQIETTAPLGLFRAWSRLPAATILVYPRAAGTQPLPGGGAARQGRTRHTREEEDFAGLRDYRFGDAPGRIHWRAAARMTAPPVKTFDDGEDETVLLDYDAVLAPNPEDRLCQLAAWARAARRAGTPFVLRLPGETVPEGEGDAHLHHSLRALALWTPAATRGR